jgi:hypothetical protein
MFFYCNISKNKNYIMGIKRLILRKPVTIEGKNVWGRKSHLTLTPSTKNGWFHYNPKSGFEMPIDRHSIKCSMNNLYVSNGGYESHILEHLLPARWFGVDRLRLSGSSWFPYLTTKQFLDRLNQEDALMETGEFIDNLVINDHVEGVLKSDPSRRTIITSNREFGGPVKGFEDIKIHVYIDYPDIGLKISNYTLDDLTSIYDSYPQGVSMFRYRLCKFLKWPHLDKVSWIHQKPPLELLKEWADHRALDIFGMLAGIHHAKLPSDFTLKSYKSGHMFDLLAAKKLKI